MQPSALHSVVNAHPLRRLALIVYASLTLLLLAVPQQIADRLDDFEPNSIAHAGKIVAESVAKVMNTTGVPQVFERARKAFLEALGEQH